MLVVLRALKIRICADGMGPTSVGALEFGPQILI